MNRSMPTLDEINQVRDPRLKEALAAGGLTGRFTYTRAHHEPLDATWEANTLWVLGVDELALPLAIAWELYSLDVEMDGWAYGGTLLEALNGDAQAQQAADRLTAEATDRVHGILCRDLFDEMIAPDWYVEQLTAPRLTAETALRVLELRHSGRELQLLEASSTTSARSAKAALVVAAVSTLAALWSAVEARDARDEVQRMRLDQPVAVEVRQERRFTE